MDVLTKMFLMNALVDNMYLVERAARGFSLWTKRVNRLTIASRKGPLSQ